MIGQTWSDVSASSLIGPLKEVGKLIMDMEIV